MENEVLFSLKPKFASLIENKVKNHEFRKYIPKNPIKKIFFYVTAPVYKLIYIAYIDQILMYPDKISNEGYGNKKFYNGLKKSKYAYTLIHLYKLKNPLTFEQLRNKYNFTALQSFAYKNKYLKLYRDITNVFELDKFFNLAN